VTDYVEDYISGQMVPAGPEELEAVQPFSRQLVADYGYPREHIHTRPQWTVSRRPSGGQPYPVDIAIFSGPAHNDDDLYIIVECKQKTRRDGRRQLENYLELSKASLGVWFNGEERLFLRKYYEDGNVLFDEIPNIPLYGQRVEDIGQFERAKLRTPTNLQTVFRSMRSYLAGNAVGTRRDEMIAHQMINIILCKIYDERFTKPDAMVTFRRGLGESADDVKARLQTLFELVKAKYPTVLDLSEQIELDADSLAFVVGELQNYCLQDAPRDAISEAFEVFVSGGLKGDKGQFFTPRNVIRLLVHLAAPSADDLVLDPACGSGGFLVETLRLKWAQIDARAAGLGWSELAAQEERTATAIQTVRGVEVDDFLSKVAKAYMAIIGDGRGGIYCEDSLKPPAEWARPAADALPLGGFDVVVTNPPFGKDIKVRGRDKLSQYDLAHKWTESGGTYRRGSSLKDEMPPQVLFIERCLQFLRDGGRLAIVLPETYFHAPTYRYILQFIKQHNLMWIVDLPHNTFRPHCNAKTLGLVIQKNTPQQAKIGMAVAEEMGHDHQGREMYRWDPITKSVDVDRVWDDLEEIIAELERDWGERRFVFEVPSELPAAKSVYVPRYFWNAKDEHVSAEAEKAGFDLVPLGDLYEEQVIQVFDGHGSPESAYKGRGEVPYIRVKDIVNWEVYRDPTSPIPAEVADRLRPEAKRLQTGDVLFVKRGSYRIGSVAMVAPYDEDVVLTREILVFRVKDSANRYGIDSHYLLWALEHKLLRDQLFSRVMIDTTLPNLGDRWKELQLPVHRDPGFRQSVSERVGHVLAQKWQAARDIQAIREELGDLST